MGHRIASPSPPLRWWQAHPLIGLLVGWLTIGLLVWEAWQAW
jgi:hypothetical protein